MRKICVSPSYRAWSMLLLLIAVLIIALQGMQVRAECQESNTQPDVLIALRVISPNGEEARATVIQGGAFSIEDQITGERIAFFPEVSATNQRNVLVKVFQASNSEVGKRGYSKREIQAEKIEELEVLLGTHKSMLVGPSYSIEVEAIIKKFIKKEESKPKSLELATYKGREVAIFIRDSGGECCVVCNGRIYCSNCNVETSCGCCHTVDCSCP